MFSQRLVVGLIQLVIAVSAGFTRSECDKLTELIVLWKVKITRNLFSEILEQTARLLKFESAKLNITDNLEIGQLESILKSGCWCYFDV